MMNDTPRGRRRPRQRLRRAGALGAMAGAAVLATACAGPASPAGPAHPPDYEQYHAYSQCMRSHGAPFWPVPGFDIKLTRRSRIGLRAARQDVTRSGIQGAFRAFESSRDRRGTGRIS